MVCPQRLARQVKTNIVYLSSGDAPAHHDRADDPMVYLSELNGYLHKESTYGRRKVGVKLRIGKAFAQSQKKAIISSYTSGRSAKLHVQRYPGENHPRTYLARFPKARED